MSEPRSELIERFRSRAVSLARAAGVTRRGVGFTPVQQEHLDRAVADLRTSLAHVEEQLAALSPAPATPVGGHDASILEVYTAEAPSAQTAVDIFAGEWAMEFPPPLADIRAGAMRLWDAPFIRWGLELLGGVQGSRVVELGPLEGGHTYMMDRMGAAEVVAIEANTRAYLKCLIVKELLGIPSARFLCGDFVRYFERELARGAGRFDVCLASGVLYHMRDPVGALDLMCRAADRLVIWTHYYDHDIISARPELAVKFPSSTPASYDGFEYTLYRQEYQHSLAYKGFCGGSAESSAWLPRADILAALDHFGFEVVGIDFEEPEHQHGPCFCLAARRKVGDPTG